MVGFVVAIDFEQVPAAIVVETLPGQVIVGLTVSLTVTVWVDVVVFPLPSVTVQITVVLPNGNAIGASLVTLAILQLSVVVGTPKFTVVAVHPVFVDALTFAGDVIVGLIVSVIVTF